MTSEYPMVSEFRSDSPRCASVWNGASVAATEAILRRYRPADLPGNQRDLGRSMGARHRQIDPGSRHGLCPTGWCLYCAYLELKGRAVPVSYGPLSIAQLREHARRRHALLIGGWYNAIRPAPDGSFDATTPAGGRSDRTEDGRFRHALVVWAVGRARRDSSPQTYLIADPDFGSPARPSIPPFCEYDAREVEAFYRLGQLAATYCLTAPPALDEAATSSSSALTVSGVSVRPGGALIRPRAFAVTNEGGRQRRSPYVRADNVIRIVGPGTLFRSAQATLAGTNVGGSTRWYGDATGLVWMHESVIRSIEEEDDR